MHMALQLARQAARRDEVPVGAVIVQDGRIIGEGSNQAISAVDCSAHAEVVALRRAAAAVDNYRLPQATLYVTLEPCMMCAGALVHARVKRLVIGALEPKAGAVISHPLLQQAWLNHRVEVTQGICAEECGPRSC